jgi:hypothetical protein
MTTATEEAILLTAGSVEIEYSRVRETHRDPAARGAFYAPYKDQGRSKAS